MTELAGNGQLCDCRKRQDRDDPPDRESEVSIRQGEGRHWEGGRKAGLVHEGAIAELEAGDALRVTPP
jgi:hypothetical protein